MKWEREENGLVRGKPPSPALQHDSGYIRPSPANSEPQKIKIICPASSHFRAQLRNTPRRASRPSSSSSIGFQGERKRLSSYSMNVFHNAISEPHKTKYYQTNPFWISHAILCINDLQRISAEEPAKTNPFAKGLSLTSFVLLRQSSGPSPDTNVVANQCFIS